VVSLRKLVQFRTSGVVDLMPLHTGCGKMLRVKSGDRVTLCYVVWNAFPSIVRSARMIGFKQIKFFEHEGHLVL